MKKYNIQFSIDNKKIWEQSFEKNDDSYNNEEFKNGIIDILNNMIIELKNSNIINKTKTIVKPNGTIFKIDKNLYEINYFNDALKIMFKYLIDNKYINDKIFKIKDIHDKIFICKIENKCKLKQKYTYKNFMINVKMSKNDIYNNIILLANLFRLEKKINFINWE